TVPPRRPTDPDAGIVHRHDSRKWRRGQGLVRAPPNRGRRGGKLRRTMELTRRRFMYLCGLAAPGIWVAGGVGFLIPDPALAAGGPGGVCSFCGRAGHRRLGLIGGAVEGALGASARICADCVGRCRDMVSEMDRVAAEVKQVGTLKP